MKIAMIAALAAAQLTAVAAPAQASGLPRGEAAAQQKRFEQRVELDPRDGTAPALAVGAAPTPLHAAAAQEEAEQPRKKRKSTGDKVLTGAAVVLGIGALAVGGLLVAIFVN